MVTAIGKELRFMRLDLGELLKDMADKLHITPSYLSSIENGKFNPTRKWFDNLCKVYNLSSEQRQKLENAYYKTLRGDNNS